MKYTLYVGTYTKNTSDEKERSEGIWICSLDTLSGELERLRGVDAGPNPAFLCFDASGQYLYAANETQESQASAFKVDRKARGLMFLNRERTLGRSSCYVNMSPSGRWLVVANYSSGSLTVLPIREGGSLGPHTDLVQHQGSGPNSSRQESAHAHSIVFDSTGRFALAADLGIDRVLVYRLDEARGKLLLHDGESGAAEPGAGPRHMAWHPGGTILYVANELNATVAVYGWDSARGSLKPLQSFSTLPEDADGQGNTVADIHLTPNGRYLLVSNRGHNSLASYRVDAASGLINRVGVYSCGGNWPRNFAIHREGKYLLVANQYSNNLVVFQIHEDGSLSSTGEEIEIPAPVCVLFAP